MARLRFSQRFPHFGIILVLAVVLAIPLTVWSLNNVSTQIQQHAAYLTPTPAPSKVPSPTPYYACASVGGTCVAPTICNGEGGTQLSGQCTTGAVCCKFKQSLTPTPIPSCSSKGGSCVTSKICGAEGGIRLTGKCSIGVCCKF